MFSNLISYDLLKWTFSFHLSPKKQYWDTLLMTQLSFKKRCTFFSPILEREIAMGTNKIEANSANFALILTFYTNLES